jgi:hypothetical protein
MQKYIIVKNNKNKKATNLKENNGYKVKPSNNIKYSIKINEVDIINKDFIDKILKKKVSLKLDKYLNYLITILEDDDADGSVLAETLNDIGRWRMIIKNKYKAYLDENYLKILLKKLNLIEKELKEKMDELYVRMQKMIDSKLKRDIDSYEEEKGKSR